MLYALMLSAAARAGADKRRAQPPSVSIRAPADASAASAPTATPTDAATPFPASHAVQPTRRLVSDIT